MYLVPFLSAHPPAVKAQGRDTPADLGLGTCHRSCGAALAHRTSGQGISYTFYTFPGAAFSFVNV